MKETNLQYEISFLYTIFHLNTKITFHQSRPPPLLPQSTEKELTNKHQAFNWKYDNQNLWKVK